MKKILLSLITLAIIQTANAQTIWSEDFSSVTPTALPTGWVQINGDGLTPSTSLSAWNFGTNAWVTRDVTTDMPTYGKIAASTSWYTVAGTSNDWMITPAFTPVTNSVLEWDAAAPDANYADGYIVKIATNGGTTQADFTTTLLTVPAENPFWTKRAVDLTAYAGQNIRIAIINNSVDKFLLYTDNFKAFVPSAKDGNVTSANGTRYAVAGTQTVSGTFRSLGYVPVTSATLNYQVGAATPVSQTFNFATALQYAGSTTYSFSTPANVPAGMQTIKVWVSNVNGTGADTNPANDSAKVTSYVATQSTTMNTLIEEFTSSTCGPCASLNATFDPLLNTNNPNTGSRVNVIKYNMNWPSPGNDPSYNPHGDTRKNFYGVNGIPFAVVNGRVEMSAHNQAEIDAGKTAPAYANITATLTRTGNNVNGTAIVTPYLTIPSGSPIKVFQVLAQQFYNFPTAATTQKNYYHIERKMNPNGFGSEIASMTSGTPQTFTFANTFTSLATPAQNSFDLWNSNNNVIEYVVFIQDTVSGHVLQSASAQVAPTGLVDLNANETIGLFPNPANEYSTLAVKTNATTEIALTVIDMTGKVVYSKSKTTLNAGQNEISFSTKSFANGMYQVIVTSGNQKLTDKLTVAH